VLVVQVGLVHIFVVKGIAVVGASFVVWVAVVRAVDDGEEWTTWAVFHHQVDKLSVLVNFVEVVEVADSARLIFFFKCLLYLYEVKDFIWQDLRLNVQLRFIQRFDGKLLLRGVRGNEAFLQIDLFAGGFVTYVDSFADETIVANAKDLSKMIEVWNILFYGYFSPVRQLKRMVGSQLRIKVGLDVPVNFDSLVFLGTVFTYFRFIALCLLKFKLCITLCGSWSAAVRRKFLVE
jgi:hypothetical protein